MGLLDKILKRKPAQEEPQTVEKKKKERKMMEKKKEEVKKKPLKSHEMTLKPEAKAIAKKVAKPQKGETGLAYRILIKPVVTEKVTDLGTLGKYVFEISPQANKTEVRQAIEKVYGVSPVKINIIKIKGKKVRYGRTTGNTKEWKKAIVTLKAGETLEIYEGV